jgi:predicted phage terminase large subunit-like protein
MQTPWYLARQQTPWHFTTDQNVKSFFGNSARGYRISTSVGGMATGLGGDILVGDDLHSTQEDFSTTRAEIEGAKAFWQVTMATRFTDAKRTCRVLVGQRVAIDDVSAAVLKEGSYAHLKIPMEFERDHVAAPTPLGWGDPRRQEGELLSPARFGPDEVALLKRRLGHRYFAQFQQRPATDATSLFPRTKWRFFHVWPALEEMVLVQSWDARFGDSKESGSYVGGHLWGRVGPPDTGQVFLLDRVFERLSFTETAKAIMALSTKWPGSYIKLLEAKANGPAIYDFLRSKVFGLVLVQVDGRHGSKLARAEAVSMIQKEEQRAWLPHPSLAPWVEEYMDHMEFFPANPTDDTDSTSQAWQYLCPPKPAKDVVREAEAKRRALQQKLAAGLQRNGLGVPRTGSRTHV